LTTLDTERLSSFLDGRVAYAARHKTIAATDDTVLSREELAANAIRDECATSRQQRYSSGHRTRIDLGSFLYGIGRAIGDRQEQSGAKTDGKSTMNHHIPPMIDESRN
jgi:hypothetical protein